MRVLIVEDEPELRALTRAALEMEGGFDIAEAVDCATALEQLASGDFEVVILDVQLPDGSGLDVLRHVRATSSGVHVMILSGAASEDERVTGLAAGADDYVVKPFSLRELVARLTSVRRRLALTEPTTINLHDVVIDAAARTVTVGGAPVMLTRREFELLRHLAASPGRTFTRDELLRAVWGSSSEWQSDATVTEHISRLRRKIEPDPLRPSRIVTSRGVGYRFERGTRAESASIETLAQQTAHASLVATAGHIVHATPAALELLRARTAEDVVGHALMDFVAPVSEDAAHLRRLRTASGMWPRPELITALTCDGDELLVELATTPVVWSGAPAAQITVWDLTRDTARLRALATGITSEVADAVIVADGEMRIRSFNVAAEELYGWREAEVIGRSMFDTIFVGGEQDAAVARTHVLRDGHWHGVVEQRRHDGSTIGVTTSVSLVRDGGDQAVGFVAVNRLMPVSAPNVRSGLRDDAHLAQDVRRGLDRAEFVAHYQPVVRLEDGRWLGVEALARWQHPERGLLVPADFSSAFDHSELSMDLGYAILEAACRQSQTWRQANRDLHMAVNLSGHQFSDTSLLPRLAGLLTATSMPRGSLWLEVTETSLVHDLELAAQMTRQMGELGVRVSIDDFGTGWASLTYLREFDVHSLKIDRSFVSELGGDRRAEAIVRSVVALGAELDIAVVAEGVETEEQRLLLLRFGCVVGQGYLFGKPMSAQDLGLPPPTGGRP